MHIVIIGNGITGITCARNIRKADPEAEISVISSESEHFFSRTALMYIYMGHMKYEHTKPYEDWFWKKNRIKLIRGHVRYIGTEFKTLSLVDGSMIHYSKLIIATGSKPNKFGWPGQDLKGVQGLYSLQDLESMNVHTSGIEHAVVVGGGLIGIEMAEMLLSRNIQVTFLVREKAYWDNVLPAEEASLISRHIQKHHINLLVETELKEIISDENGRVKSIITSRGEEINCQFVGLTAGVNPNIDFLKDSGIQTNKGILVNEFLETNIQNVFAAGDCAEFRNPKPNHPAVEQLWYTGKLQAEALSKTISGKRTVYERGIWFNSAKFLDIEYQTYGLIFSKLNQDEASFYWEHPNGQIAFRATYKKASRELIGFNFLGLRFRQNVAERWINSKISVDQAIRNLKEGWFDAEFSKPHYIEILDAFSACTDFKKVN
ncbi:NAD(P)/FAD-dependent oxidoreductase [Daejeonella oryzae]|uniref:NAD(P)/FAD-dependent oxidoreductase n=1 Tax=Daejeonella oryzae TaxID=1122943 RepID=UPI0004193FA0|nr:FAD/NAD(P)-binding oxidoreductase [Daejeonella oryzae]